MNKNLAEQSYWDDGYSNYELREVADDEDMVKDWIKKNLPDTTNGSCLEIGCFPGRYLTVIGRKGYKLNGIDLTPRVEKDFPEWLKSKGFDTGTFEKVDFFKYKTDRKFDVVCSFGFIEHFPNWQEVFEKHLSLVKKEGYVIITTPNFRGIVQRMIHYFLDRENYNRHYIPSMRPDKWAKICKENGFKIMECGFIGEFQFWVDKQPTGYFKKKIFERLIRYTHRLKKLKAGRAAYSPFCGVIAIKERD
ncbi:MAG: class I SAM-dependent methyltransferase [Bacteroidetes bacterium]|nr:class I SAM-dependent methyltransferase [Bacteroidota bacterium]